PYSEQVVIPAIGGTSATNTVTINGNNETLTFLNTTAALPSVLELNGADYIKVNNLNIVSTASAGNAFAVHLWNNADFNRFSNCTISCNTAAIASTTSAFSVSGAQAAAVTAGLSGTNDSLINCTVTGGYYTVVFTGPTSGTTPSGNFISGCTINDSYLYSIYSAYNSGIVIDNNRIQQPTRTTFTTFYGVFLTTNSINAKVTRNHIRNLYANLPSNTSASYAIYVNATGSLGNENIIANNIISHVQNNGAAYGIYALSSANHTHILHNTISYDNTLATGTTTTRGIWLGHTTAGVNVLVRNNIITISRGGTGVKHGLYYGGSVGITSNNNVINILTNANHHVGFLTSNFTTLANWQTANAAAWDQQSVDVSPVFANPTIPAYDFTPTASAVNNIGAPSSITVDYNNTLRSLLTPDPGAIEFTLSPIDMAMVSLVSPNNLGCYTATQSITVNIQNAGNQTMDFSLTPLNLGVQISGAINTTLTGSINSGTLASNASTSYTFTTPINMSIYGAYTFRPYLNISGDLNAVNDSLAPITRSSNLIPGNVTTNLPNLCVSGSPTMTVTGAYGGAIQWQSSPTALGPWTNVGTIGSTSYLASPAISQNTFYRVELTCNANTANSNALEIQINNPQIISTLPDTVCAPSVAVLQAAAGAGSNVRWFANQTGGSPLFVGSSYTTPVLNNNTTYWAEASAGAGGVDSFGVAINAAVTCCVYHHMVPVNVITGMEISGLKIVATNAVSTLASFDVYYRMGNYQLTPGANTSSAGWTSLGSFVVSSAGAGNWTNLNFASSIQVPASSAISFYVLPSPSPVAPAVAGTLEYTISSVTTGAVYASNSDLQLLGGHRGSLFSCTTTGSILKFQVKYSTGCTGTRVPVTAVVNPTPVISASPNVVTVCQTQSTTLNGSGAGAGGTYSWTGGITNGVSFVPAASTVYTVTGTDANGCSSTATANVWVNPIVSGTATAAPTSLCFGGTTTLTGTPIPQCFGNSLGFAGHYAPVNWTQSVSNSNGFVNFLGAPTQILMTSGNNASSNSGTTNYAITIPCPGTITFNWSYTNIGFAADDFPMYKVNNGTALLFNGYSLVGAQTQTGTQSITVNAGDVVTLIANTVDNDPFACQITISNFSAPAPPVTGTATFWDAPTGGNNVGASPAAVVPTTSGTLTYYAQFTTDVTGCVNPTRVPVNVTVAPQIALSASAASTNLCTGESTTLTATAPTATTLVWSAGTTPNTGSPVSVTPATSTTYTVTATDASGCTTASSIAITVNSTPSIGVNASPSAPVIVCTQSQLVTLSGTGAAFYTWSGGINDGIPFTANAGTSTYTVTGTSVSGCSNTATITVTGNASPLVTASSGTPIICNGSSSLLSGGGASTYVWSGGPSTATWSVSPTAYTVYTVTGTDANGCSNTSTTDVDVYSLPNISASGPLPLCQGASGTISASAIPSIISSGFNWEPGTLNGNSHVVSPSSSTTYTVTATDGNGCSNTATVSVTVNSNPSVSITAIPAIPTVCIQNQQVTLSGNGATTYTWSGGISNATAFTALSGTTTYTVTGSDGNGCSNTATIDVVGNDNPTVNATAGAPSICIGNTSVLSGSGAATYVWSGGPSTATWTVQPTSNSSYTVTGSTAAGCSNTASVSVVVVPSTNLVSAITSTDINTQPDGLSVLYTNSNCDLITNINDGIGGNSLGATAATVNLAGGVQTHNGQPYVSRWYQITPSNNGPATITLYYTQGDFNTYNAYATANNWPTLPTGPLDATGIANMRVTKVGNAGLGNNPLVLTPQSVTWNAVNSYWEVVLNTPGFSQFYAHAQNPNNVPLPATVTDFSGYKQGEHHRLSWTTQSEYNNAFFTLEYSRDGNNFTSLANINSQAVNGNSQAVLHYGYTHTTPMLGHNYYRLRQTDIDGQSKLEAKVVDLIRRAEGGSISIYPNPTEGVLQVSVYEQSAGAIKLVVRDMSGRVVKTVEAQTASGNNQLSVDLSAVAQGIYTLQCYSHGELVVTERIRKQ
ncbi:MAG: T9SS type A sorting domain-containing protein, partial [Chitinophagaceae bacterium]|nr:T9SS type A sorting domain-containing protein [Chitinophagaceae bacterium]